MSTPYYSDESVTLYHGHDLDVLRTLPDGSVDCVVTSPPYFGLRDYGQDGQRGLESSPAEYVAGLVEVFREVRRVLADDGTVWLNLGDSYVSVPGKQGQSGEFAPRTIAQVRDGKAAAGNTARRPPSVDGLQPKNLLGIPWRVAFALQDDGWTLRNDIIWSKPNAMPESVTDRLSTRHEHVFLLTKSRRYWFDLDAVREPHADDWHARASTWRNGKAKQQQRGDSYHPYKDAKPFENEPNPLGRNPGDVWTIPTAPFPGAHFAVFPLALAERCILAGCKPGGTVLDPYNGSGTTGLAATKHGRRYTGIDLSTDYLDLSLRTRLRQGVLEVPA